MKKSLKLLLFTIAVPIFICIHGKVSYAGTYPEYQYIDQPAYGTYITQDGYEKRWGLTMLLDDGEGHGNNLTATTPPIQNASDKGQHCVVDVIKDHAGAWMATDKTDGWQYDHAEWLTADNYTTYGVANNFYDEYGQNFDIMAKNKDWRFDVMDAGSPMWRGEDGTLNQYRRLAIIIYKRVRPAPVAMGADLQSVEDGTNTYYNEKGSTPDHLWVTPEKQLDLTSWGIDKYPNYYGSRVQKEGRIVQSNISLTGDVKFDTWYNYEHYTVQGEWKGTYGGDIRKGVGDNRTNNPWDYSDSDGVYHANQMHMTIQPHKNQDIRVQSMQQSKYDGLRTNMKDGFCYDGKTFNWIRTDGDPPHTSRSKDAVEIIVHDSNNITVNAYDIVDDRVGLDDTTPKVAIWDNDSGYRDWYRMWRIAGTNNFTVDINLANNKDTVSKFGTFHAHVYASDYLQNTGFIASNDFNRVEPIPTVHNYSTWVTGDEYFNNNIHWVQQGNKFNLGVNGYADNGDTDTYKIDSLYATMRDPDHSMAMAVAHASIDYNENESWKGDTQGDNIGLKMYNFHSIRNGGSWVSAYFDMCMNNDGQTMQVYPLLRAYRNGDTLDDAHIKAQSQWWEDGKGVVIKSDGQAPTVDRVYAENITKDGFDVVVVNPHDVNNGSGLSVVKALTYKGSDWQNTGKWQEISDSDNNNVRFHINVSDWDNYRGDYTCDIRAYDHVGNGGSVLYSLGVHVPDPVANVDRIEVTNYEYKDSDGAYWVKPNDQFHIKTVAYTKEEFPRYQINGIYALLRDYNSTGWNSNFAIYNGYIGNEENISYSFGKGSWYVDPGIELSNGYLQRTISRFTDANYDSVIKTDGKDIRFNAMSRIYDNGIYWDDTKIISETGWDNISVRLRSDGIAPGFTDSSNSVLDPNLSTIINFNQDTLSANINVYNLVDKGSGTKQVYAKMYPTNREAEAKNLNLNLSGSVWSLSNTNLYNLFKSSDINVEIYTLDNVGNIGMIKKARYDLFTVRASIVPYDNQAFTGVPTLMQGERAILKITTTGEPNKLQITFPEELNKLDNSLNKSMDISPQQYLITNSEFYVPLYAPIKDGYAVNVKAIRGTETKEVNPIFNIRNSILDNLRTRRKE